jgi:hypothetical protein
MRTFALAMVSTFAIAASASAQNVHLKPPKDNPMFTDQGLFLEATGAFAGLSGEDILVNLSARADVSAVCINPGTGGQQPAGQNPAPITVTGSEPIPVTKIKNGNTDFDVKTLAPSPNPIPGAPGCPNTNWTEQIVDLAFTQATLTVIQPATSTTVVFTAACIFTPATKNGVVPDNEVSCTIE